MVNFEALLRDLSHLSEDEAFDLGRKLYSRSFLNQSQKRGELVCHDGMPVIFWAERYDHAFRTSVDRARKAHDKSKIAVDRIERMDWIANFLCKPRSDIFCKEKRPPGPWKRAYFSYDLGYIVWLEQASLVDKKPTAWRFSSAYPLPIPEIKRVTAGFRTV